MNPSDCHADMTIRGVLTGEGGWLFLFDFPDDDRRVFCHYNRIACDGGGVTHTDGNRLFVSVQFCHHIVEISFRKLDRGIALFLDEFRNGGMFCCFYVVQFLGG